MQVPNWVAKMVVAEMTMPPPWLVGWLVDVFLLDDSWTPVPDAVGL